jgi:NAD(P)-dependent dehydrogenase (short-subunit alcohol dehydrogenase family)
MGGRVTLVRADIGSPAQVQGLMARAARALGRIDVLINNAAVVHRAPFLEYPLPEWDRSFAVNLRGAFLCAQAAARVMVERGTRGRIINMSSVGGMLAHEHLCAYDSAKAGIQMLTRGIALELAPFGITANCIAPGAIEVDRNRAEFVGAATVRGWKKIIPLGHWGRPEDIAQAVVFLCSDDAGFITGQTLVIDGGQTIALSRP